MITWFGAGLLATFTALSTTKVFERSSTPRLLVPFLITSVIVTAVALGFAKVGFEWEATRLRRMIDDQAVPDIDPLPPTEERWPAGPERFWLAALWTMVVTGVVTLVCAWWPFATAVSVTTLPAAIPPSGAAEPSTQPYVDIVGSATTHVPALLMLGFALLGAGVAVAAWASTSRGRKVGAGLAIAGTLIGSGAIFKDTKIESIFRLEKGALEGLVKTQVNVNGTLGPELIGSFPGFSLGSTELDLKNQDVGNEMRRLIDRWIAARASGRNGVLMFVGSADRVPLGPESRRQYEANAGVARARAESVRTQMLEQTKGLPESQRIREEAALVLVSGPRRTPALPSNDRASARAGFPEDRRVDVWAFWTTPAETAAPPSTAPRGDKR
jgi:hypothetical protein